MVLRKEFQKYGGIENMIKDSKILGPYEILSDKEIQEIVDGIIMKFEPINNMRKYYVMISIIIFFLLYFKYK